MVQKTYNFKKIAVQLIALLKNEGVSVERLYLYGSQVRGTAHEGSDIDLVIISKDLARFEAIERLEFLSRIAWKCDAPVEIIGYTPSEIKNKEGKSIFWDEILSSGKIIYKKAA